MISLLQTIQNYVATKLNLYNLDVMHSTVKKDKRWKHGFAVKKQIAPEYSCWATMVQRCTNKKSKDYKYYGGRGIRVCNRWRNSFVNFLKDIGKRPSKKHSLERKDNDGHYTPSNCRWATKAEQSSNRRDNRILTYKGQSKTITEWARLTGSKFMIISRRIARGWSVEDALTEPIQQR